jgi:hypothetical protein
MVKLSIEQKQRIFEQREVFTPSELKSKIRTTGYEAFRVSPRATMKFGKMYKKIYGATVSPDYSRPVPGKKNKFGNPTMWYPKVQWFPHGYTSSKVKGGTRLLTSLSTYPIHKATAKRQLML